MYDHFKRFLFNAIPVRGEHVRLQQTWHELLQRRHYPDNVRNILGELVAVTALLGATIKFDGKITVQIQSQGQVKLVVVQMTSNGGLRALARCPETHVEGTSLQDICGTGQLIITVESANIDTPYQGIIPLIDETVSAAIERYFNDSEQLPTIVMLAANQSHIAGLLIQRLPGETPDEDAFNRITHLTRTVKKNELLDLSTEVLLTRLYSEDEISLFDPQELHFHCNCSRESVQGLLMHFSTEELQEIFTENQGIVEITCEFCGKPYSFTPHDIKDTCVPPNATRH